MTNDDLHELVAGYALGALGDAERRTFEEHLSGCERCRAELGALSETVGALAYGVDEGPVPPAALRDHILVQARAERTNVIALRPRRVRLYAGAAIAAAACAALAIGLWAGLSGGGDSDKLAWSLDVRAGVAHLTVTGLPKAPAGKDYEIWVIENGTPRSAGLFEGGSRVVTRLTRPAPPGSTVAVTLERDGGVDAPTTPVLLSSAVPA